MDKDISYRLFELRRKFGYSQEELADKINVSRQAVSKWERGESSPDTNNLIALAKLYGISVDELLDYKPTDTNFKKNFNFKNENGKNEKAKNPDNISFSVSDDNTKGDFKYEKEFHINRDNDGVKDFGLNVSYGDESNNEEQDWKGTKTSRWTEAFRKFPYPILCLFVYLLLGFLGGWWHPSWIIFLTIPIYYSTVEAIASKRFNGFPFISIVIIAYLLMGFLGNLWHPGWVVFLTIPLYSFLIRVIKKKSYSDLISYPFLCVIIYLVVGFSVNIWHPTWLIFITIPIVEYFLNFAKLNKRHKNDKNHNNADDIQ